MEANTTTPSFPPLQVTFPVGIDVGSTLGMLFVGLILAAIFYGVTLLQTIYYYHGYPDDSSMLKSLVAVLWALDTLSVVLVIFGLYNYLITNFGDPLAVHGLIWSTSAVSIVTAVTVVIVNCRWKKTKMEILRGCNGEIFVVKTQPIPSYTFLHDQGNIAVGLVLNSPTQSDAENKSRWIIITTAIFESVIDVVITTSICYLLYKARSGIRSSDQLVNRITLYVVTSGLTTATLMLTLMIAYLVSPTNMFYALINVILPHAYVNTFLATLNSRNGIKGNMGSTKVTSAGIPQFKVNSHSSRTIETGRRNNEQEFSLSQLESGYKTKPIDL
ncbi:hypothetical protein BU17DRAFT_65095 [Hysterangium stoloniferum]|nr:hypothetical protein BU17DRAFT_65095 [Hysterangium stoloniferum]